MYEKLLNKYGINQAGYIVDDLEQACLDHSALFGTGPFIYMPVQKQKYMFRGQEYEMEFQMAYSQLGGIQIEMIKQFNDTPSPYKEQHGFNHFSMWVDDLDGAIKEFADAGFEVCYDFTSGGGMRVVYVDCVEKYGHFVEMHQPIEGFWNMIKKAAEDWDGTDPYRMIQMG